MITLTNLMRRKALTGEARLPVTEVLFQERSGHLRYVILRAGGTFHHDDVLVAIGRFDPPVADSDEWAVVLDRDELATAPTWQSENTNETGATPLPLEAWPPIVTGPFGNTTSPLLFYAALTANTDTKTDETEPRAERKRVDPRVNRLERATRRLGAEVFGADGSLGGLSDLVVDPQSFTITDFVVGEPARQVPYSALRHMADDGDHTVLDLDRAAFDAAPLWQR